MDIMYYQNGLSYHPSDRSYNEKNYGQGIGLRDKKYNDILELAIGQYKNSVNKNSNYIDASYHKKLNGLLSLGAGGGLVTGYGKTLPYILPSLKVGNDDYEVNLRYAPKTKVNPSVLMLNFGYRL